MGLALVHEVMGHYKFFKGNLDEYRKHTNTQVISDDLERAAQGSLLNEPYAYAVSSETCNMARLAGIPSSGINNGFIQLADKWIQVTTSGADWDAGDWTNFANNYDMFGIRAFVPDKPLTQARNQPGFYHKFRRSVQRLPLSQSA